MKKINLEYGIETTWCPKYDEYCEWEEIIKNDFEKIARCLISDYENSENLVKEMLFASKNITNNRPYDGINTEFIRLTDKYLSFSYPIYDQKSDEFYSNKVIVDNYKKFYFVNRNYPKQTYIVKRFIIEDNKVLENEYEYKVKSTFCNDKSIDRFVLRLENL